MVRQWWTRLVPPGLERATPFSGRELVVDAGGKRMTRLCSASARSAAWRIQNVA